MSFPETLKQATAAIKVSEHVLQKEYSTTTMQINDILEWWGENANIEKYSCTNI